VNAFLIRLTAIGVLAAMPAYLHAECRAQSPPHAVALIELYTSEGCDSCPPADRWLSQLEARPDRVVPLGLHVDYWDRLGWKDRFASPAFTQRQYEQMRRQRTGFVYTPQILLQGRDFSQWRTQADAAAAIASVNARRARATIELAAQNESGKVRVDMHVSVPDAAERSRARVAVALVQDRLVSEVKAGENAGKRLSHDHVVRQWTADMPVASDGELRDRLTFPLPTESGPIALAAFVEDSTSGEVLQAFALPLCSTP